MKLRDYYAVLGVERTESPEGIRRAFHELAVRYHPDRAGDRATALFQELVEAYRVLWDARARTAYDRAIRQAEAALPGNEVARAPISVPFAPRRDSPEPLAAWGRIGDRAAPLDAWLQRASTALAPRRNASLRNVWITPPDVDQVRRRVQSNLQRRVPPDGEALEPVEVELILTADQAAVGGGLSLEVPVFFPCETCRGGGELSGSKCPACQGEAVLPEPRPLTVPIPPGVPDGAQFELQLRGLGLHSLYVRVRARVLGGGRGPRPS